jgi:hypothetical protein
MSLRMLDAARVPASASVIDVGGSASRSPGRSCSAASVTSRCWTSPRPGCGTPWITSADDPTVSTGSLPTFSAGILSVTIQVWHDRAAFHFLITDEQRRRYLHTLDAATAPGAVAVFGYSQQTGPGAARVCQRSATARHS